MAVPVFARTVEKGLLSKEIGHYYGCLFELRQSGDCDDWAGKEVHLWGFVVDRHGRASQSVYIGSGVLGVNKDENGYRVRHFDKDENP